MKLREMNIKFPDGSIHTIQVYAVNRTSTGEYIMSYYEVAVDGVRLEKPQDCFTPIINVNGIWYKDPIHREWNEYDIIEDPEFSDRFISTSLQDGMVMGSLTNKTNDQKETQPRMAASFPPPPPPPPPPTQEEIEKNYYEAKRKFQELINQRVTNIVEIPLDLAIIKCNVVNLRGPDGKSTDVYKIFIVNSTFDSYQNRIKYEFLDVDELDISSTLKNKIHQIPHSMKVDQSYQSGLIKLDNPIDKDKLSAASGSLPIGNHSQDNHISIKYNVGMVTCLNVELFSKIYNSAIITTSEEGRLHVTPIESLSKAIDYKQILFGLYKNHELFSNEFGVDPDGMTIAGSTPTR